MRISTTTTTTPQTTGMVLRSGKKVTYTEYKGRKVTKALTSNSQQPPNNPSKLTELPPELLELITSFAVNKDTPKTYFAEQNNALFTTCKQFNQMELDFYPANNGLVTEVLRKAKGKINRIPANLRAKLDKVRKTITALDLHNIPIRVRDIRHIVEFFPELRKLNLSGCEIFADTVTPLVQLKHLEELNLNFNFYLSNTDLLTITKIKTLKWLDISRSTFITGCGLYTLIKLKKLEHLRLCSLKHLTDEGLSFVRKLEGVKTLHLSGSDRITSDGIKQLKQLKKLEELSLSYMQKAITTVTMQTLSQCTTLKKLDLSNCENLKDKHLLRLHVLTNLTHLDVTGCSEVTPGGVEELRKKHTLFNNNDSCLLQVIV
jgi:hypothetical protein